MLSPEEKKELTERDICTKYITPALQRAGWDIDIQIREELAFTKGRIIVRGKLISRGKIKRADYVLSYKPNLRLAVIEAKENKKAIGSGMEQALDYARTLDVPFAYSSNGDGFVEHDLVATNGPREREIGLDEFPSPESLWRRYCAAKGISEPEEKIVTQEYYSDNSEKEPRYYQEIAINRTVEAIAAGQKRVMLVLATGTGKTYCAFQIIWRLWKARKAKRILFLADRTVLVEQTKTNDFKPFGEVAHIVSKRTAEKSKEVYLALYQQLTGAEEKQKVYREFSKDFFDLIIIDECHRGSARDDSAWREILTYFSGAVHIGLTATPRETKDVSNTDYFGKPVYTYSLRQGISDGFLAPYKVIRIDLDKDLAGWRPEKNQKDKHGNIIEDRVYNQRDFDRNLVLDKRTKLVAQKITEYLKGTNRMDKTIVFCEDIDHATRMRKALANENTDLCDENHQYIARITGDNEEGKALLDPFITPHEPYPVIATTSKLMTTGVDAQTCKLIVLDRIINSMGEFKQIIGRGTRVNEDFGKTHFAIMDFKRATELFADPNFDGEPVQVYEPGEGESPVPPEGEEAEQDDEGEEIGEQAGDNEEGGETGPPPGEGGGGGGGSGWRWKYYVHDVEVHVVGERIQYFDKDGKLITESLKDYTKKAIQSEFSSLNDFLKKWTEAEQKDAILDALAEEGVFLEALAEEVGRDYGAFDLICHVAYGRPPLTRRERAGNVKKRDYFAKYGDLARRVLESLLEKYADQGISDLGKMEVLKLDPFRDLGTPIEIIQSFGGKEEYQSAIRELQNHIYDSA